MGQEIGPPSTWWSASCSLSGIGLPSRCWPCPCFIGLGGALTPALEACGRKARERGRFCCSYPAREGSPQKLPMGSWAGLAVVLKLLGQVRWPFGSGIRVGP